LFLLLCCGANTVVLTFPFFFFPNILGFVTNGASFHFPRALFFFPVVVHKNKTGSMCADYAFLLSLLFRVSPLRPVTPEISLSVVPPPLALYPQLPFPGVFSFDLSFSSLPYRFSTNPGFCFPQSFLFFFWTNHRTRLSFSNITCSFFHWKNGRLLTLVAIACMFSIFFFLFSFTPPCLVLRSIQDFTFFPPPPDFYRFGFSLLVCVFSLLPTPLRFLVPPTRERFFCRAEQPLQFFFSTDGCVLGVPRFGIFLAVFSVFLFFPSAGSTFSPAP